MYRKPRHGFRCALFATIIVAFAAGHSSPTYGADCNENSVPDPWDIDPSDPDGDGHVSDDCNGDGIPDECQLGPLETAIISPQEGGNYQFGTALHARDKDLIIGEPIPFGVPGRAHVYRRVGPTWEYVTQLSASDGVNRNNFGGNVAIHGNYAIVGAVETSTFFGAAYIYRRDFNGDWHEEAKLQSSDIAQFDRFGGHIAIEGVTVVISSTGDDDRGSSSGAVYIFDRSTSGVWQQTQKLTAPDGQADDSFGASVSLSGLTIIVGANGEDDLAETSGAAYVYQRVGATWQFTQKLKAADASVNAFFGSEISLQNDVAVIGATGDNSRGAAYIFRRNGASWQEEAKLHPDVLTIGNDFGSSVSIDGNVVVVGAPDFDGSDYRSGGVFVYQYLGGVWEQTRLLTHASPTYIDQLGYSAGVAGMHIVAGARYYDEGGGNSGRAFAFPVGPYDCNANGIPDDCDVDPADPDGDGQTHIDCNANLLPDSCEQDCNGNGFADVCDLDPSDPDGNGITSVDCNSNGFPDECEIDCNNNGFADDCDLDPTDPDGNGETSLDCNLNGIPDECEPDCDGDGFLDECQLNGIRPPLSVGEALLGASSGVSIDGDVAIVGTGVINDNTPLSGAAIIYRHVNDEWALEASLYPADVEYLDAFALSVSISGDTAIVGAYREDVGVVNNGSAYVFRRVNDVWEQEAKLIASDAATNDYFGISVSISGDTAVVGAYGDDTWAGAAYVFTRMGETWTEEAKLRGSDTGVSDLFGASVSIDGDVIAVGAYGDNSFSPNVDHGSAYVFRRSNGVWTEESKLLTPPGRLRKAYGFAISIHGDTIVVGAPPEQFTSAQGSAYAFRRVGGQWQFDASFPASENGTTTRYGAAVQVRGDVAIVGAPESSSSFRDASRAFMYHRYDGAWHETRRVRQLGSGNLLMDGFGAAVAMNADSAIVGANYHTATEPALRRFHVVDLNVTDCNANSVPDACDDPGDMTGDGEVDLIDLPDFVTAVLFELQCPLADMNLDGVLDGRDLSAFAEALLGS